MHGNLFAHSGHIAFEYALYGFSVFLPHCLGIRPEGDVVLKVGREVEGRLNLGGAAKEPVLLVGDEVVQHFFEGGGVAVGVEGEARKGYEGFAKQAGVEPGETCSDLLAVVVVADEEICPVEKLVAVAPDCRDVRESLLVGGFEALGILFVLGCRHGDGRARLEVAHEAAGRQEVFAAVESAAVLVGVGYSLVPDRVMIEFEALGIALEHQVWETFIEAEGGASLHRGETGAGSIVLVSERVDAAERQEGTQLEGDSVGSLKHFVADEELVLLREEHEALAEDYISHLVGDGGNRVVVEVHHVLVAAGLVYVAVAVYAKIELLAAGEDGFVQRRQQQVLVAAEAVQRDGVEAVVAARVAGDDARVAISARLVCTDNLPLQRVGKVHQLGLVELEECHVLLFL